MLMAPTVGPESDDSDGEDGLHGPVLPKAKKQPTQSESHLNLAGYLFCYNWRPIVCCMAYYEGLSTFKRQG